jgi:hypothetical protein
VARGGNIGSATRTFEQLLGNFPQAFTYIGLINAALTLPGYQEGNAAAERPSNDIPTEDPT